MLREGRRQRVKEFNVNFALFAGGIDKKHRKKLAF
jgi:hypothetical protein